MWQIWNKLLNKAKKIRLLRAIYRIRWVPILYHYCLALVGAVLYSRPSERIKVIGITGTKGKSSTLEMLSSILEASGKKTALLSSVRIKIGEESHKNKMGNTMPGRFFIQDFLARAVKSGCEYALIEVASQGIVSFRHKFIKWIIAGITNLAPEHIEAHGSFEAYRMAKYKFLKYAFRQKGDVFINGENDELSWFSAKLPRAHVFSLEDCPEIPPEAKKFFPGVFSRENLALASVVARHLGSDEPDIKKGILNFRGVPGRMEVVQEEPFKVIVDYAHTPDSLESAYNAVLEDKPKKLICVLGSCGGGRDKWKRPIMGEIAASHCQKIFLTNEDPFDEDPRKIISDIKQGIDKTDYPSENLKIIPERREAISKAIVEAEAGDTVIITGKGSEPFYHEAGEKIPWSDRRVVEEAINSRN